METKSITFGFGIALILLAVIGGTYAAIAGSGQEVTVPTGKTMIYFTMDTEDAIYLRESLCHNYNYQKTIYDINGEETPNPQTCTQFGQQKIIKFAKDNMEAYHSWQYDNGYVSETWDVEG